MTKEQVKKILEQNDIIVKKQYGQNFLLDDNILKNIDKQKVLKLKEEVAYQKGQVVSKTLAQNEALSVTFFF